MSGQHPMEIPNDNNLLVFNNSDGTGSSAAYFDMI